MNKPQPVTDDALYECQDCGAQHTESELEDIEDFDQRVSPGEETPAGECPDCGALCHPIDSEPTPDKEPRAASISLAIDAAQRATLLAALRFYQMNGQGDPGHRRDDIHELATANDAVVSLDNVGIRSLFRLIARA